MTRVTKANRAAKAISPVDLKRHIAGLLAEGPKFVEELVKLTKYSSSVCRARLYVLEADGEAHRQRVVINNNVCSRWIAGPATDEKDGPVWLAHQPTYRKYPPIVRRDPLVAALFGEAGVRP